MSIRTLILGAVVAFVLPMASSQAQFVFVKKGAEGQAQKSPRETTQAKVGSVDITVDYGSPSVRGRVVFDSLVPYGKVWRTGANKATHITTSADLTIGGQSVPAGRYTLYTIPNKDSWTLIINKLNEQWGTVYEEDKDLVRIPMEVKTLDTPVEKMEITVKDGRLHITWDKTDASVAVSESK